MVDSPLLSLCLLISLRLSCLLQGPGLSLGDVVFPAGGRKTIGSELTGGTLGSPHPGTLTSLTPQQKEQQCLFLHILTPYPPPLLVFRGLHHGGILRILQAEEIAAEQDLA